MGAGNSRLQQPPMREGALEGGLHLHLAEFGAGEVEVLERGGVLVGGQCSRLGNLKPMGYQSSLSPRERAGVRDPARQRGKNRLENDTKAAEDFAIGEAQ